MGAHREFLSLNKWLLGWEFTQTLPLMFYTGWFIPPLFHLFVENTKAFIKILSIIINEKQDKIIRNVVNIVSTIHLLKPQP